MLQKKVRAVAIVGITIIIGTITALLTTARTTHEPTILSIDHYASKQFVRITGTISDEPDRRPMQTKYTVAAEQIEILNSSGTTIITPVRGKVLATDQRRWPEFQYGDQVEVMGTLEKPGKIETFHYDRYLSRFGIYSVIYRGSFKEHFQPVNQERIYNQLFATLYKIKSTFESQINRLYSEPHASFMAGLLTGSRRGIPEHLLQKFNITGLTHIIAISGYNITIVISIITGLLFWLPLKWRFVPAVIAIIAFTIFVGASAAVVRAAIMGILGLLALQVGRQNEVRLTILWTLFFMVCWNPKFLWYDAGFQLSFLAVFGLTELGPMLDRWFACVPDILGIREALQMTCAAQLAAVPLIILLFGRFSLVAPLANVLVAPFIPLAMLFGFLGTIISFISFPFGQIFAYLGWGCLEWIVWVATIASQIPYASVDIPGMSVMFIAFYYVGIIAWIICGFGVRVRVRI